MANISQMEEDRARSQAGQNQENVIVHHKVLRKALLKMFYAESVNEIMKIVGSCDMKEPEPYQLTNLGGVISPANFTFLDDINKKPTY